MNGNPYYWDVPNTKNNVFINAVPEKSPVPTYGTSKELLPKPFWDGHSDAVACHDKAWQIAFGNLREADPRSGFVSNYIDTAFNGCLFMWDSAFITMFGKYGVRAFDFHKTLNNFYARQHRDGFICRELFEHEAGDRFSRDDPISTGPNILPWVEWEHYTETGDTDRISKVFDPLYAYHLWLFRNRSWPDGAYWTSGYGSGMDNQPRLDPYWNDALSHGHLSWIDATAHQYISATVLVKMADLLGRSNETKLLEKEAENLYAIVNDTMWDEEDGFYYDTRRDGKTTKNKTIGAYWALLAGLVPENRRSRFISHLENEAEFNRPTRIPTWAASNEYYCPTGGYWRGGVWAPTNYMVMKGLTKYGYDELAHEIALSFLNTVVTVCNKTGTLFENYSPEEAAPGDDAARDFVGWTGLAPISVMYEYVFGIRADVPHGKIIWDVRLTDRHGIADYPFGDSVIDLECAARKSENDIPQITAKRISGKKEITIEIRYANGAFTVTV